MPVFDRQAQAGIPTGRRRSPCRGQSLVEFALILPALLLVVLIGLDFGRSFLAWVGLNNAARIAANYASLHPDAWVGTGIAAYQTEYDTLVTNDYQNSGCPAPNPVPAPVFADSVSTIPALGSQVSVALPCHLPLVTPLIGGFFPSGVPITGGAIFAVRGGAINGSGGGGGAPAAQCTPAPLTADAPADVAVTSTTALGTVTNWLWDFGDGTLSTAPPPFTHTYTTASPPGTPYTITLTATNTYGTTVATCGPITVTSSVLTADFTWTPSSPNQGDVVTFSGTASGGTQPSTWSWQFGDGGTATGASQTHTYTTAGSFTVTATVHDSAGATVTPTHVVSVAATCPVPHLVGTETTGAQKAWKDAGFSTNVVFSPGAPPKYVIGTQTPTSPNTLPCASTGITVTP